MTKTQLKTEALNLLNEHKANKKLVEAITTLMASYTASKSNKVIREKMITIDDEQFVWCNRHEVYEPIINFSKGEKSDCCILAHTVWNDLGKQVTKLSDDLTTKAIEGEDVQEIAAELKSKKELRGGKYNFIDDKVKFPEIENYIYDDKLFHQDTATPVES